MEATANFEYIAIDSEELSIKPRDKLVIFPTDKDEDWITAESLVTREKGLVYSSYIDIKPHDFFQSTVTRDIAENALSSSSKHIGAYLIRSRSAAPKEFSLSVKCDSNKVQHFKIQNKDREFFIWPENKFKSINQLVDFYKEHDVSKQYQVRLADNDPAQSRNVGGRCTPQQNQPTRNAGAFGGNQITSRFPQNPTACKPSANKPGSNEYVQQGPVVANNAFGPHMLKPTAGSSAIKLNFGSNFQKPSFEPNKIAPSLPKPNSVPPVSPRRPTVPQFPKYKAMYDYQATSSDEMTFYAGETLEVIKKNEDGWWEARVGTREGIIPHNYIEPL